MFGKPKWYRTAYKLYRKHQLEEPYRTLLRYYMFVGYGTPIAHNEGHYEYFNLEKFDGDIDTATENLRSVLPDRLFKNYLSALEAYKQLGDDPEYERLIAALEQQDIYVTEHCEEITELLINRIAEITEKSFIKI